MIYMLYVVRTSVTTNLKRTHYYFYIAITKIIFANKKSQNVENMAEVK